MKSRYLSKDYIGLRLYTCMDSRTFSVENISVQKKVCKTPTWKRNFEQDRLILALYSSILYLYSIFFFFFFFFFKSFFPP